MPFVGADPSRKRRWDDDHEDAYRLYSPDGQADFYVLDQPQGLPPRKILPLSKRPRISDDQAHNIPSSDYKTIPPHHHHHRRRSSQQLKAPSQPQQQPSRSAAVRPPAAAAALTPCHICHRRPTKRSDLDSFAACQGCGERACYVCIRACHGWAASGPLGDDAAREVLSEQEVLSRSFCMDDVDDDREEVSEQRHAEDGNNGQSHGEDNRLGEGLTGENGEHPRRRGWHTGGHRDVVCSRCCIERGTEGDVVCLGCLSGMEGA